MKKMRKMMKSKSGQTMVEYIIIVVIIAIAAIAVVGVFSDRIRAMFGGASIALGGDSGEVDTALSTDSADFLQNVDESGLNN